MLVLYLLLASCFCFVMVPNAGAGLDMLKCWDVYLPAWVIGVLSIPPHAHLAVAGGLAVVLLGLVIAAPTRKVTLVANAVGIVLIILAIFLVETALRHSLFSVTTQVQKQ